MAIDVIVHWGQEETQKLARCLSSILEQPVSLQAILVIDDSGVDREKELRTASQDEEISYYKCSGHESELEMVCSGIKALCASEEAYVQFMEASDYVQIDWFFQMQEHMKAEADIIFGEQDYIEAEKNLFYYNFSISRYLPQGKLEKQELLRICLEQGGKDRSILSLHNKLIRLKLLTCVMNRYGVEESGLPVEYFVFCLFHEANHICNEKYSRYFCDTQNALWMTKEQLPSFLHAVEDICLTDEERKDAAWKDAWNRDESFFESAKTDLGPTYQYYMQLKQCLEEERCEYVGFDIFDTLIERPFWEPTDLFYLLNDRYNELTGNRTCIDFSLIRRNGEAGCRGYYSNIRPSNEDVTLDEIYRYISEFYGIDREITDALKEYEVKLELKYCKARRIGKELLEWALYCGKKIVLISDMYLPSKVIIQILERNGLKGWQKLYLSNEIGLSKYSGRLYDYVIRDLGIEDRANMCFIGDNYEVDIMQAQKRCLRAFHVPKAVELFAGENKAIYAGNYFKKLWEPNGSIIDQSSALKFIGIRCMMAVVANRIYGNPFVNFHEGSDFNADPAFIGYFCAGMFLFSEAKWILDKSEERKTGTIHFVSRDGYYIKRAYDILRVCLGRGLDSDYLYFSRKAVAPLYMNCKEGIYELFLPPHVMRQTPEKVIKLLWRVIRKDQDYRTVLQENGIAPQKQFGSMHEFYIFAKVFEDQLYDPEAAKKYADLVTPYFRNMIHEGDVICDVGYSGRMETALTKLLGFPVSSYYFHEHEPWALMRKRRMGFRINSFYSFKPCSAFVVREQLFTPNQASCSGFEETGDGVQPVFDPFTLSFTEEFVLGVMQKHAVRFVEDMTGIFGRDLEFLDFNAFDACIPLEFYLHYAQEFDRKIFSGVAFEDEFGTGTVMSMQDYWEKERHAYRLDHGTGICAEPVPAESGIYRNGVYMKLFYRLNRLLPVNSRRRDVVKHIARIFVH